MTENCYIIDTSSLVELKESLDFIGMFREEGWKF